ncbi:prolipoprotein diacylglyceryl transferase [Malaciobacter mytili LMG 24559]|uniref:Phosphatidylglycerol--prolipoprotein diacylglyceryl transferase n=1 Tax=Malaciobacter mytili LMG 24559 TaxID=1032238 RepID=A0AAX2ADE3_9BACT|nr:prolipoprotein diacylglyceryl transferase [Malaciobacter mytili]AXH15003.1 phosphatidylglycerol-prolipoprotein diacylglyceryl transferase [Malaciobacter mytili LMG 24559]RXK15017.1 prolipoprotein diacylglyceryl transferase [Malaciobacter mytili LMG 24559]
METWQNIYSTFDPVAFNLGDIAVHWYGIMYALALLSAIIVAKWFIKYDKIPIKEEVFDSYIWWAEIGVILGARLGYILFYDTHTMYYLTHPWQIFNPFIDGVYAGISGMSYHGAVIGFIIASYLFCKKNKVSFYFLADIAVIGVSAGYVFGRIGNFFNQELIGRATDVPWGIYVGNTLRHPSQLYEAVLEGILIFVILVAIRKHKTFVGQLALLYGILYSIARIIAEIFRQPDIQLGFIYSNWLTMGMLQSSFFAILCIVLYIITKRKAAIS